MMSAQRPAPAGHGRSFGQALKWSYVMDIGRQATSLLVTFVLARVLGPGPFGIVAMATVYIAFLKMLLAQGMVPAIIQRRDLRREHTDAAFWMVLGTAIPLTVLTAPLSGWWASVNDTPDLGPVVLALSLLLPIEGLKVVHEALLRRDLDIRPLAIRTNASVLVGAVVGVVFALVLRTVWALVAQQLVTAVVDVVVLWRFSRWRPRLQFRPSAARDLLSFSVGSSFASLGVFVNNRADVLVTGLFFGQVAVGLYRFASRLVDTAVTVTVTSLQGASLPELARHQHDPDRFAGRMVVVSQASSLLALPVLGVLVGVADPLIAVLGPDWAQAASPLAILCIMGGGQALSATVGPMLQALGHPRALAVLAWVNAAMSAGSFVLVGSALVDASVDRQLVAMSWSRAALYGFVFLAMNLWVVRRYTRVRVGALVRAVTPGLAGALAAAGAGLAVAGRLAGAVDALTCLVLAGSASAAAAGAMLYALDPTARLWAGRFLAKQGWGGFATAAHGRPEWLPYDSSYGWQG